MTNYWWVNHKQTFEAEVGGGYLWSPKANRNGSRSHFYDNMTRVRPGDLVFSYANAAVRAIGTVASPARDASRPDEFGKAGERWDEDGWLVPVEFRVLDRPVRTMDHAGDLAPVHPGKYSPLQLNGQGNQGAYLSLVPVPMAEVVLRLLGETAPAEVLERAAEAEINNRTDISATQKLALVMSRRGQGRYRQNLVQYEPVCRVTGLADQRFLIASHMKPWSQSTDFEKLDGNNGLLLSPHVDRLFDRGFISFADNGAMLTMGTEPSAALAAWGISKPALIKPFRPSQLPYLDHHRARHGFASSTPYNGLQH